MPRLSSMASRIAARGNMFFRDEDGSGRTLVDVGRDPTLVAARLGRKRLHVICYPEDTPLMIRRHNRADTKEFLKAVRQAIGLKAATRSRVSRLHAR